RHFVEVFEPYEHVVTPSASCASMVKLHLPDLLADEAGWQEPAARVAAQTREFTVFLREVLGVDLAAQLRLDQPCTFHYPCHAREIYSLDNLRQSLQSPGGPRILPPARPEECCGFGGMFAVDYPEISAAMLNTKLDDLAATGARRVVCNEGGCTLHLSG